MNFVTNIIKKYIKNETFETMESNSEDDILSSDSKTLTITSPVKSPLEFTEHNCNKNQIESPENIICEPTDLINLDSTKRYSQGSDASSTNGQINSTFNFNHNDTINSPIVNKQLVQIKTANLLSLSGSPSTLDTNALNSSYTVSNGFNDSKISTGEHEDEIYYPANNITVEDISIDEFLPASSFIKSVPNITTNNSVEQFLIRDSNIDSCDEKNTPLHKIDTKVSDEHPSPDSTVVVNTTLTLVACEKSLEYTDDKINVDTDSICENNNKGQVEQEPSEQADEFSISHTKEIPVNSNDNFVNQSVQQIDITKDFEDLSSVNDTVCENNNKGQIEQEPSEQADEFSISHTKEIPVNSIDNFVNESVQQINKTKDFEALSSVNDSVCENNNKGQIEQETISHTKEVLVNSIDIFANESVHEIDITKENIDFEPLSSVSPISPVENNNNEFFKGDTKTVSLNNTLTANSNFKMTDLLEKLNQQQADISDLKLKLNAAQQHNATLELQIRQNEEIVIKAQAEALRTEQNYQQEVKQLKEKLNENSKINEKDRLQELEEQLKDSKAKEAKLMAELAQKTKTEIKYQKMLDEFQSSFTSHVSEIIKLQEENDTIRTHLANLELAFSDVHSKYEKTKASLQGLMESEQSLLRALEDSQATNIQHEERYESLKAHATTQIEKSNKEIHAMKEHQDAEINKLKAFVRRLEIKVGSLEVSLQQKTEECEQLSALCEEVTGKRV